MAVNNSAGRLRALLAMMQTQGHNLAVIDGWIASFSLSHLPNGEADLLVARQLLNVRLEVEQLARDLEGRVPDHLTASARSAFLNAISPRIFSQPWANVMQHFPPQINTSLDFCVHLLPADEQEIDVELWNELRAKVEELRGALDDEKLPTSLRELIRHHVELIEDAIQACRVRGVIRMQVALDAAGANLARAEAQLAAYNGVPAFGRLISMWQTAQKIGDFALKVEKYSHLALGAKDFVAGLLK